MNQAISKRVHESFVSLGTLPVGNRMPSAKALGYVRGGRDFPLPARVPVDRTIILSSDLGRPVTPRRSISTRSP